MDRMFRKIFCHKRSCENIENVLNHMTKFLVLIYINEIFAIHSSQKPKIKLQIQTENPKVCSKTW